MKTDTVSLFKKQLGRGPDLVLLHGWALSSPVWGPVIEQLAASFRVTLIDLPGHGKSKLRGEFEIDALTDAIVPGIPKGATLLGWSLGGMLGMALAARRPALAGKLILLAANPRFVATQQQPAGLDSGQLKEFAAGLMTDYDNTIRRFLAASTLGAEKGPALLRHLAETVQQSPRPDLRALRGGLDILRNANLWDRLPQIRCPTLVMLGERDTLVPVAVGKPMTEALRRGQLLVIKGAGHAPFLSHSELFVAAIREFAA